MPSHIEHKRKLLESITIIESEKRDWIKKNPKRESEPVEITMKRADFYRRVTVAMNELKSFNRGVEANGRV